MDMDARPARASLSRVGLLVIAAVAGLLFSAAWPAQVAQAATLSVNTTADELNSDSDCALREAIQAANTNTAIDACGAGSGPDTIALPAGTYRLAIAGGGENGNASGDLDVAADLTVNGASGANTVVDGDGLDRVFHIVSGAVDISDLTVRTGSSVDGGGIRNEGTLTLNSSSVSGNTAPGFYGGGIFNLGQLSLNSSTVSGNTAGQAGGGIISYGSVNLNRSTVSGNTAGTDGGGIFSPGGLTLTNSTVSSNTAGRDGGGIINFGPLTISSSTISSNTAGSGGGIFNGGFGTVTPKNTIVADNSSDVYCREGEITSAGHNLIENAAGCTIGGDTGGNIVGVDPMLGPLADNGGPTMTRALLGGSPAIDAGSPDCPPPATDQRGVARPERAGCDIGAFELEALNVNTTADELNSDGDCSLREAIQAANTDTAVDACVAGNGADTIDVPAGTYTLAIAGAGEDANATGDLDITADLTMNGAGAASTLIDGTDLDRVLHVSAATATISAVTVRNGFGDFGGGILNQGTLTLRNSTVSGNTTPPRSTPFDDCGGGIFNASGQTLELNDSSVSDNITGRDCSGGGIFNHGILTMNGGTVSDNSVDTRGGGINNSDGATARLANVTVSGNHAAGGGGGIHGRGTLTLIDSEVSANLARGGGGIRTAENSTATLTNVTVSDNTASSSGGGISADRSTTTLTNVTVSGNRAVSSDGGGIFSSSSALTLNSSTVSGNSAGQAGGGIETTALGAAPVLKNTIVANGSASTSSDCRRITSAGHNLIEDSMGCVISGDTTGDIYGSDPLLGQLQDNGGPTKTHALLSGSPAIDAGSPDCPPPGTDQRGATRPLGAACDIGAVENDPTPPAAPAITDTDPDSPANDNDPEVKGNAETGSTVKLYTSSDCSGSPAAQGTASAFNSPGLTVSVPGDTSTTFTATAADAAGNTSPCSGPFAYTEDSTPPTAPAITDTDPDSPANDNSPEVKGSAEAGSTVKLYQSNDCSGAVEAQDSAAQFNSPGLTATVAADQAHPFTATATDQAGNASPCSDPFAYTEDSTPPETTIDSGPSGDTNDPTPTFTFSSSEAGSTFECKLDAGAYAACSSPRTLAHLADGSYTFYVRATDPAGNLELTPATRPFTVATAAVRVSGSTLVVTAAAGAKDNLQITRPSASILRVTDFPSGAYTGSGVHTGAGCTRSGDYTADCSASRITLIQAASFDQTDQVVNSTGVKSSLNGGAANDVLTGGSANDTLDGATGADVFKGMNGNDRLFARDLTSDTTINCDGGSTPGSADKADLDLLPRDPNSAVKNCETKTRH